jgi:phospholipase C
MEPAAQVSDVLGAATSRLRDLLGEEPLEPVVATTDTQRSILSPQTLSAVLAALGAIVCSPWIPHNVVDHREYEHAAAPSTVERLWGLPSMTDRDAHARDLSSLLTLSAPCRDAPTELPDAAQPEARGPGDPPPIGQTGSALRAWRPKRATILDAATLATAQQENPRAITSTAAAFFQVALRRDLLLAPPSERPTIFAQARRFQTMGEVSVYARKVIEVIDAYNATRAQPTAPTRSRRRGAGGRRRPA